jgi:hypothetical protein
MCWIAEGDIKVLILDGSVLTSRLSFSIRVYFVDPSPVLDSSRKAAQMLCQALGFRTLNTVYVLHRTKAFGLVVTHQDGWRLV